MVERIHTPWNIIRHPVTRKIITAFPLEKVSGDFRGIFPGGRSVLCEVKSCDKLLFSAFDKHQIDALNNHTAAGGLSLVGWKWPDGDSLMIWPIVGFRAGTSLSPDQAKPADISGLVMY
jgi:penicillin-binding protein-related factor A (putative recombinase)